MPTKKSEETRLRILTAALAIFRERGFEQATMREIASQGGVALGAAYYYFQSKEAIVMAFYERSQQQMSIAIDELLDQCSSLEDRLHGIINYKFEYFALDRKLLGALSAHADPNHPLSPFSRQTLAIRQQDLAFFERAVKDSRVRLPANIKPYLPRLLWLYQMGLILYWVYDQSPGQERTTVLFDKTLKMILLGLRLAGIPFLRPVHRLAAELLAVMYEKD
ncbi:MAG TPA: TetR family transcriptional regulator [Bryobacteraceae bacterium]